MMLTIMVVFILFWIAAAMMTPICPSETYFSDDVSFTEGNNERWYIIFANQGNFFLPNTNETICVQFNVNPATTSESFSLKYLENGKVKTRDGSMKVIPNNLIQYKFNDTNEQATFRVVSYNKDNHYLLQYKCEHSMFGIGRYETFTVSSSQIMTPLDQNELLQQFTSVIRE